MKFSNFYKAKEIITRLEKQPTEQEKIIVNFTSHAYAYIVYLRVKGKRDKVRPCLKKINKNRNHTVNKWANELYRQFSKEEAQMNNKRFEKHSAL